METYKLSEGNPYQIFMGKFSDFIQRIDGSGTEESIPQFLAKLVGPDFVCFFLEFSSNHENPTKLFTCNISSKQIYVKNSLKSDFLAIFDDFIVRRILLRLA